MTKQRIEIVDWDTHYEVSQSRRTQLHKWVAIPNKHDGRGYSRIAMMPDGAEIFCAWILIVQVASKMPKRGVLADSDGPLSISDIAVKTRYPEKLFQKAVKILAGENIGWLRVVGHQSERGRSEVGAKSEAGGTAVGAQSELHDITEHDITEHDITEQNHIVPATPKPCEVVFDHWRSVTGHNKAILDPKRTKLINAALKLGYTVEQLKQAIDGNKASAFHQGDNDRKTVYDGLDLILRDAAQIDKFIALADGRGTSQYKGSFQELYDHVTAQLERLGYTEKVVQ